MYIFCSCNDAATWLVLLNSLWYQLSLMFIRESLMITLFKILFVLLGLTYIVRDWSRTHAMFSTNISLVLFVHNNLIAYLNYLIRWWWFTFSPLPHRDWSHGILFQVNIICFITIYPELIEVTSLHLAWEVINSVNDGLIIVFCTVNIL